MFNDLPERRANEPGRRGAFPTNALDAALQRDLVAALREV
jgi:hypothetical protein